MPAPRATRKSKSSAARRTKRRTAHTRPPRILILTMSAGSGHVSAAQALAEALQAQAPKAKIVIADHAKLLGKYRGQALTQGYQVLTNYFPLLWQAFYDLADFDFPTALCQKLRQLFSRAGERSLINFVLHGKFDYVICTHFAAAHIIAALKSANRLTLPLAVTITDFGLHNIWLAGPQVNHYFVASERTKKQLRAAGTAPAQIEVTGIPIKRQFQALQPRRLSHQSKRPAIKCSFHPSLRLLIVETRTNIQPLLKLLRKLKPLQNQLRLTIVGLTKPNLSTVQQFLAFANWPATCHGFITNIAHYFTTHDLAITKSGGLTTAEAMACGVPLLVLRPIPGQEMTNLSALLLAGAGLHAADEEAAKDLIASLLRNPRKLRRLKLATQKLAQPKAAPAIARLVLKEIAKR